MGPVFLAMSEDAYDVLKEAEQAALGKKAEHVFVGIWESP